MGSVSMVRRQSYGYSGNQFRAQLRSSSYCTSYPHSYLVWYTALPIMCTASLKLLQQKLFGSKRYPPDLVCHFYTPALCWSSFSSVDIMTTYYDWSACALNLMNYKYLYIYYIHGGNDQQLFEYSIYFSSDTMYHLSMRFKSWGRTSPTHLRSLGTA